MAKTIYDIAKEAGVSPATVSRVLNGSARVSPEKRARIEELIRLYDFRVNALARGLSGSSTRTIGLLSADVQNEYYASLFASCERAAEARGYSVMIMNSFSEMEQELIIMEKMKQQQVDALIMIGGSVDSETADPVFLAAVQELSEKIPLVVIGKFKGAPAYRIAIDSDTALEQIFRHLTEMGNQRIAFIGGMPDYEEGRHKYIKFKALAREYGLSLPELYLDNPSRYGIEDGLFAGVRFIERIRAEHVPMPDAVVAINDMCAVGILSAFRKYGIRVPEDVSLVGFDNSTLSRVADPQISSVDYDYEHFGSVIIETAIEAINGTADPDLDRQITPTLIVRKSSGFVRKQP